MGGPGSHDGGVAHPDLIVDLAVLSPWWESLSAKAPSGVVGLWFGMTELVGTVGNGRHLYVAGCPTFDADDISAEWATSYCWWPEGRYVCPPQLTAFADSDHLQALRHAADLVIALRPQDAIPVDGVAVGFDDGDFRVTWSR